MTYEWVRGPDSSDSKTSGYRLDGPGLIPESGDKWILRPSHHRVQSGPKIHSTSFTISTKTFLAVKSAGA